MICQPCTLTDLYHDLTDLYQMYSIIIDGLLQFFYRVSRQKVYSGHLRTNQRSNIQTQIRYILVKYNFHTNVSSVISVHGYICKVQRSSIS